MPLKAYFESKKLVRPYLWTIICAGGLIYFLAAYRLDLRIVDLKLGVLEIGRASCRERVYSSV